MQQAAGQSGVACGLLLLGKGHKQVGERAIAFSAVVGSLRLGDSPGSATSASWRTAKPGSCATLRSSAIRKARSTSSLSVATSPSDHSSARAVPVTTKSPTRVVWRMSAPWRAAASTQPGSIEASKPDLRALIMPVGGAELSASARS